MIMISFRSIFALLPLCVFVKAQDSNGFWSNRDEWRSYVQGELGYTSKDIETFDNLPPPYTPSDGKTLNLAQYHGVNTTKVTMYRWSAPIPDQKLGIFRMIDENAQNKWYRHDVSDGDWVQQSLKDNEFSFIFNQEVIAVGFQYHLAWVSDTSIKMLQGNNPTLETSSMTKNSDAFLGWVFDEPATHFALQNPNDGTTISINMDNLEFYFAA